LGGYNTVDNSVSRKCIAGGDTIVAGTLTTCFSQADLRLNTKKPGIYITLH
jgi:hypothetical protein